YGCFFVPSQPSRPLSPQCVAMHSTMLARPNSDMPDSVWRQSAKVGIRGRPAQLWRMRSHALVSGEAASALVASVLVGSGIGSGQAAIKALCPHRFTRAGSHAALPLSVLMQATAACATLGLNVDLNSAQRLAAKFVQTPSSAGPIAGQSSTVPRLSSQTGMATTGAVALATAGGAAEGTATGTAVVGGSANCARSPCDFASCASQPPTPPAASVPAIRRKPDFSMIMDPAPR